MCVFVFLQAIWFQNPPNGLSTPTSGCINFQEPSKGSSLESIFDRDWIQRLCSRLAWSSGAFILDKCLYSSPNPLVLISTFRLSYFFSCRRKLQLSNFLNSVIIHQWSSSGHGFQPQLMSVCLFRLKGFVFLIKVILTQWWLKLQCV